MKACIDNESPEYIHNVLLPKIVEEKYPHLDAEDREAISQRLSLDFVLRGAAPLPANADGNEEKSEGDRLVKIANTFINLDHLDINLIKTINPFQRAYEIMSNEIDAPVLKVIQDAIADKKINMDIDEAKNIYLTMFQEWRKAHGNHPSLQSPDPGERRMAEAIRILKNYKIRRDMGLDYPEDKKKK